MITIISKNGHTISPSLFDSKVIEALNEMFGKDVERKVIEVQLDQDCINVGYIQEVHVDYYRMFDWELKLLIEDFKESSKLADYIEFDYLYND